MLSQTVTQMSKYLCWLKLLNIMSQVNADLKHLVNCLKANKISLNVKKTEMVIFNSKQKKLEGIVPNKKSNDK